VLCHLDLAKKDVKENVPVGCAECHGAEALAKVAKKDKEAVAKLPNQELPRLMRGQPDAVLITYDLKSGEEKPAKTASAAPVPFDHKAHEKYSDSCRVCHHANMDSCNKCHTLGGAKEGDFVTFGQIQLPGLPCGQAGPGELCRLPPQHCGDRPTGEGLLQTLPPAV
jgi:hypothetical protein